MEELVTALDEIKVVSYDTSVAEELQGFHRPESYKSNSKKERVLLEYAGNFQRQFRQLYSDRKPLLLIPKNECEVPKFICTTMCPTYLKYKELYEYDGCAEFVADYLTYQTLDVSNELPESVISSMSVLHCQRGNCFDYAILLASLLIGVGYDAYCVCGYASVDVCLLNLSHTICPLLKQDDVCMTTVSREKRNRYSVRTPKEFTSMFEKRLMMKEKENTDKEEQKMQEAKLTLSSGGAVEEKWRTTSSEAKEPPLDKFHGLRVHCWVLVLMGKREIALSFFIEPTTGETHPLEWNEYLGIETIWNHRNYWANMQDCSKGVQDMTYDLGDAATWEFFFPNVDKPLLVLPGEDPSLIEPEEEEAESNEKMEHFQLPPSWTLPIYISPKNLESRCPKGTKTILYHQAQLDKYAEYLNPDGLVTRLILFNDTARTQKTEVRETYKFRNDLLKSRVKNIKSGEICNHFDPGRQKSLKAHTYYDSNPLRAGHRTLEFYSYARVDCLTKRVISPKKMTEHFEGRSDFLYYRQVTYETESYKLNTSGGKAAPNRVVVKIVDKFHPNSALPANSAVAERYFILADNRIKVVYQLEEGRITASMIEFKTPPIVADQTMILTYKPDEIYTYQVDPYFKPAKNRQIFEQLEQLLQAQDKVIKNARLSEEETVALLQARDDEELNHTLNISVYDVRRNETARQHREELEQKQQEEERIRKEKEQDYLAPFLARIGDPAKLNKEQMMEVSQACLRDMRTRLVTMANIVRGRFELETDKLQQKQAWYKSKQGSLTKEEESEYIAFCGSSMFSLHILELRLFAHKSKAPSKYLELEKRLKGDSRVAFAYD